MDFRDQLVAQLIRHEGLRLLPYKDTVGKLTIGVGRNITDKGITQAEAISLLINDITECTDDLNTFDWFPPLDPIRQRALLDMRFNLGPQGFREFKRLLLALTNRDYIMAAASMRASKWAKQTGKRAQYLAELVETGKDPRG